MIGRDILILVPHPDDEVVGCAAAIARARRAGARISTFYLTDGVPPPESLWPWQRRSRAARAARRWREAEAAAARLGLTVAERQGIPSRRLRMHIGETRLRLLKLIARERIDRLWVPAYEGGHQDHDVANFIASTVADRVQVWEFSEYNFAGGRVRSQDFPSERGGEQVLALDAKEQEEKRVLLALYESERGNLGYVGVSQEAFRPLAVHDYGMPPHGGRTFYQRFQWVPWHPRVDATRPGDVCRTLRTARLDGAASGTP